MAYYVDKHPEQENDFERNCEPCFPKFKKLKDARAYAKEHGDTLGALPILDKNGDTVMFPQPNQGKAELRAALESANQIIDEYKSAIAGASRSMQTYREDVQKELDRRDTAMLEAGYIPLKKFQSMVGQVNGQNWGAGFTLYDVKLQPKDGDVLAGDIMTAIIRGAETP